MAILKDLIDQVSFDEVWALLKENYDDIDQFMEDYQKIFEIMKSTGPAPNTQSMTIHLKLTEDPWAEEGEESEPYIQVFGYIPGDEEGYAVGVKPVEQLVGFDVAEQTLSDYSPVQIVTYCIIEMTYYTSAANALWGSNLDTYAGGLLASQSCMETDNHGISLDALRSQLGVKSDDEDKDDFYKLLNR